MEKFPQRGPEKEEIEKIVKSAVMVNGLVYTGKRHNDAIQAAVRETGIRPITGEQGFVTNTGRFVSRQEAAQIAFEAGQTKELKDKLFSEDVW